MYLCRIHSNHRASATQKAIRAPRVSAFFSPGRTHYTAPALFNTSSTSWVCTEAHRYTSADALHCRQQRDANYCATWKGFSGRARRFFEVRKTHSPRSGFREQASCIARARCSDKGVYLPFPWLFLPEPFMTDRCGVGGWPHCDASREWLNEPR